MGQGAREGWRGRPGQAEWRQAAGSSGILLLARRDGAGTAARPRSVCSAPRAAAAAGAAGRPRLQKAGATAHPSAGAPPADRQWQLISTPQPTIRGISRFSADMAPPTSWTRARRGWHSAGQVVRLGATGGNSQAAIQPLPGAVSACCRAAGRNERRLGRQSCPAPH